MKKINIILILFLCINIPNFAQIGIFEKAEDIGNPKVKGSSAYDATNQTYTLKGGGENIWFNHDEFQFLYKKIKGDFLLTANFQLIGNEDGNGHRKTGWMIRESNQHDAVSVNSCLHGDGLAVLQWRLMRGAYMRDPEEEIFFPKEYFGETIVELERIDKKITMRLAKPGETFETMGSIVLQDLKDEVLVGPYALAHDPTDIQEVKVWNVRISTPVAADWNPNAHAKAPSQVGMITATKLETVDIQTGKRTILVEGEQQIGGQNYAKDFKSINYLQGDQLLNLPINTTKSLELPISTTKKSKKSVLELPKTFEYYSLYKNGSNQIWRKNADGTLNEQLTYELGHAREPQLSPDGKLLAYLVYPHDSNPKAPTAFQRMQLKMMPLAGGAAKTIAYFFGGKGSLVSNCWSGDSKNIVFLSR
jgi:hypothetical protein